MGSPANQLPDIRRQRLPARPQRPLGARSLKLALTIAHGCLTPGRRERFVQEPAPRAVERIPYTTDDGWQCHLFRCPPPPGASGEPVLMVHGLGLNRLSLDYDDQEGLAALLHAWGFDVYILEHRADASAFPPRRPRSYDADTIAAQDVPAAIQTILARTGHSRIAWVGHGFGGQLLYIHLAQDPHSPVFAGACLGAATRFPSATSTARLAGLVARLLPPRLGLPSRQVLRLLSPSSHRGDATSAVSSGGISGPVLRGVLNHGIENLAGGLVRQVARWISTGILCDRHARVDYLEALRGHPLPLLVVASRGDSVCPPESAIRVLDYMDEAGKLSLVTAEPCGHLDLVQGRTAATATGPAVASWLDAHRKSAW